jgi:transcriptional regulator with XRE-family HTH domain
MDLPQAESDTIVITMLPIQSKMARAALGWSLSDLAIHANMGRATVARFELGEPVHADTVAKLRATFEASGLLLIADGVKSPIGGAGVRLPQQ